MAFLKRITPYAIAAAVLLLAAFYVRVPRPLRKTPYEHLQTFSLYRADLPSVQETPYDYLMFVVQWPFALCADREYCTYKPLPNHFTIHGIWPANCSGAWLNCFGTDFNLTEVQTDLRTSWPNLECDNNMTFWKREYDKHGKCCENIFHQTLYFKTAHKMWREHRVEEMFKDYGYTPGKSYRVADLKNAVRKKTKMDPALRCNEDNLLLEVVICYDHNGTTIMPCPKFANARCGKDNNFILWKGPPN